MGCIYRICHIASGKSYVGQTVSANPSSRFHRHLSGRGNKYLANAVAKYGADAFLCEVVADNVSETLLDQRECFYIACFNAMYPFGYNLKSGGSRGFHSEKTKMLMSVVKSRENLSDETLRKMSDSKKGANNPGYGKKQSEYTICKRLRNTVSTRPRSATNDGLTDEHKSKISKALSGSGNGMFGRVHSSETRKKISEAHRKRRLAKKG